MSRRDDKREKILEAGLEILFLQGFNGTGVKDIVDAAGIPKGSFYNYFASKEDFALQALQRVAEQGCSELRQRLHEPARPPLERLVGLFEARIEAATGDDIRRGCLLGNLCQEMSAVSDPIRSEVDRLMREHVRPIEACLREARARQALRPTVDPAVLAEFVFDAWEGALLRAKCRQDKRPLRDFVQALRHLLELD